MTHRSAIIFAVALIFVVAASADVQNPPDADLEINPDRPEPIRAGVPVEFSAQGSHDLFDYEHIIELRINGILVSTESSFVEPFEEGNYEVSLYVETEHGSDTVHKTFYVYPNDIPEIEGQIIYYDPYDDREKNSTKGLSVPLHASVAIEVWTEDDSDDILSYSVKITPCCGVEIADIEEDDDDCSFSLVALEPGTYEVLITATDEAGQTDTLEFRVTVGSPKELKLERTPDSVNEEENVEFWIQHPCSYEVCDYSLVVEHEETGEKWDSDGYNRYGISFSDEGFVNVVCNVSYNGTLIDSVSETFLVYNTVNDPPKLWITLTEPVYVQEPVEIHVEAWDDSGPVGRILVKVFGDYVDDARYNSTEIRGSEGNITLIPRRVDTYEIVAKSCDPEGECTEVSAWLDSQSPDEAAPDEEHIEEEQTEEAVDWNEGSTEDTGFLSAFMTLLIIAGAVLLMRKQ